MATLFALGEQLAPRRRRSPRRLFYAGSHVMRQRLENRRLAETFAIEVGGLSYTATVGHFPDGRVAEIFLNNSKPGSASDSYVRDAAIAVSLALQYGCPLETLRRALLRDPRGAPSTPIGCVLDLLAGLDDA
jgi:ribonucleoside-diphosphate reductase alpha chain